jgi:large subunit ribosomal protein L6
MSRIGKKPIAIPKGTEITVALGVITVKGPLGELKRAFDATLFDITVSEGIATVIPKVQGLATKALWGTYASHIGNMIEGVNKAFEKKLIVEGVGFRADVKGTDLALELGFSHDINMPIPAGLTIKSEKGELTISGIDKEAVGQFAAKVRSLKKPEPYKGKGVRYSDETIRRKQGKKAA